MNNIGKKYDLKRHIIDNVDLYFIPVFLVLSILFILIPPYNEGFLRIIFALPLLLLMPGYMFIAAMFPKRGDLGAIERFTLSIGLSIAITVFDGFGLNYTQWGFRPDSITISLSIIIMLLLLITFIQRWRYGNESYSFSIGDILSFFNILKTKETQNGPEYDPALEKMLIKTMIIAILIVSAMLIYGKMTQEPEKFTALYILGENRTAENYSTQLSVGEQSSILVGVENYEYAKVNYSLIVNLGGIDLTREDIYLDHGDKWLKNVTFTPQLTSSIALAGTNKSKLEFQLLKDNKPYRSVHLLVNTSLDSVKFAQLPRIVNGDMESNRGWEFSGSSPKIIGGYNDSTVFSSRVYEINFGSDIEGSKGIISQNLTTNGIARALLSFDIKDSWSNISNNTYKQVLLDNKVIWESKVGIKNGSWDYVEIPVMLSGNNSLSFLVYNTNKTNLTGAVWWDNIELNPYRIALPQFGEAIEKGGLAVKLNGLSNSDNLSSIKLSIENLGNIEKTLELKPLPILIDDLGNKYGLAKIESSSWIKLTPLYPGILRNGTIFFNPINTSAKYLRLILFINGERYEFGFQAESGMLGEESNISIKTNATIGETITQEGFAVMLKGFQNTPDWASQVTIAVKNMDIEEKTFNLNPSPILIDDMGNQYMMVKMDRVNQIKLTSIYPGGIRRGAIFFEPINPDAKNLRLILYLNGEKYEFNFKADSKILIEKDFLSDTSVKINAAMGDIITQDGFMVMLKSFQNNQNYMSQIIIAVKNADNEVKQFILDPPPVLIDDLGNQYEMVKIERGTQIKQTPIYPEVIRRGAIFFEPISPDANNFRLILYLNGKKTEFGFQALSKIAEEKGLVSNISANTSIYATVGEAITQDGFDIQLKSYQNTPDWASQVNIAVKNIENENKLFKYNLTPVLIDDLGNQYEMVNIKRSNQIEQTTIAPLARIEGSIFFEPIQAEAKYIIFVLRISSEKYLFGFENKYYVS